MDLMLSDDQAFLLETTRRFLAAETPITVVRALADDPAGFDPGTWRQGCELGWTSLLVAPEHGGGQLSEHGLSDLVLIAEEMGRRVAPGPLVPVNLVASAVSARGTDEQRQAVLPGLVAGTATAAWTGVAPLACERVADRYRISGTAPSVEAGAQAAHLLVAVEADGGTTHLLIPADAPGLSIVAEDSLDLVRRFAAVTFSSVEVGPDAVIGLPGEAAAESERLLQIAAVLVCAEAAGAADHCFEMTLEYLGDRYSFGRQLASYQALKHRLADDKMWLEACHATVTGAAEAVAAGDGSAAELVSVAKAWVGPTVTELIQDCVQLHGGIGVTWEHDLHLYLRRATVDRLSYGAPHEHAERIALRLLGAAS